MRRKEITVVLGARVGLLTWGIRVRSAASRTASPCLPLIPHTLPYIMVPSLVCHLSEEELK